MSMGTKVKNVSWLNLMGLLQKYKECFKQVKIFGIPKNGMILAGFIQKLFLDQGVRVVYDAKDADIIVDDIIDSGATMKGYNKEYPHKTTFVLFRKDNAIGNFNIEYAPYVVSDDTWVKFPWEQAEHPEDAVTRLLQYIGEDVHRDGLKGTPDRVCRMYKEMTVGYGQKAEDLLKVTFEQDHDELILLNGIRFTSLCEHHLLPFTGRASIGYIPSEGRVVGISKLARVVHVFAKRLQLQERLTQQIANVINDTLKPLAVGVVMKAQHSCIACRGVREQESQMVTSCLLGEFRKDSDARQEFLKLATV